MRPASPRPASSCTLSPSACMRARKPQYRRGWSTGAPSAASATRAGRGAPPPPCQRQNQTAITSGMWKHAPSTGVDGRRCLRRWRTKWCGGQCTCAFGGHARSGPGGAAYQEGADAGAAQIRGRARWHPRLDTHLPTLLPSTDVIRAGAPPPGWRCGDGAAGSRAHVRVRVRPRLATRVMAVTAARDGGKPRCSSHAAAAAARKAR